MAAFKVLETLGKGAQGIVYRAIQKSLDREVALKVLIEKGRTDPSYRARFAREISACARITHPNVVKILDYGEIEGQLFYAMEYVDAPSLARRIKDEGQQPIERSIRVLEQLLLALSELHAHGLIHRDLKPANVLVADNGHVTLMDFGLVKDSASAALTVAGKVVGTPSYLAPESVRGEEIDARSDLFSAGVVAYEMLAGQRPFKGDNLADLLRAIALNPPPSLVSLRPEIPRDLAAVVERLLAKRREDRYGDAATAVEALGRPAVRRSAVHRRTRTAPVAPAPAPDEESVIPTSSVEGGLEALTNIPVKTVVRPGSVAARGTRNEPTLRPSSARPTRPVEATTVPGRPGTVQPTPPGTTVSMTRPARPVVEAMLVVVTTMVGLFWYLGLTPGARKDPSGTATAPSPVTLSSPNSAGSAGASSASVAVASDGSPRQPPSPTAPARPFQEAEALGKAMALLETPALLAELDREYKSSAGRDDPGAATPSAAVSRLRDRWGKRLSTVLRAARLETTLKAFVAVASTFWADRKAPPRLRAALSLGLEDLDDLQEACAAGRIPLALPLDGVMPPVRGGHPLSVTSDMNDAPLRGVELDRTDHADLALIPIIFPPGLWTLEKVGLGARFHLATDASDSDIPGTLQKLGRSRVQFETSLTKLIPENSIIGELEVVTWILDLQPGTRFVVSVVDKGDKGDKAVTGDQTRAVVVPIATFRGPSMKPRLWVHPVDASALPAGARWLRVDFRKVPFVGPMTEYGQMPMIGLRYRASEAPTPTPSKR